MLVSLEIDFVVGIQAFVDALRCLSSAAARHSGSVNVMLTRLNLIWLTSDLRAIRSAANDSFTNPVRPCASREAAVASEATSVTARDEMLRGQTNMNISIGVDTRTIAHRFGCAERLKSTNSSVMTPEKISTDKAYPATSAASLKKKKTNFNEFWMIVNRSSFVPDRESLRLWGSSANALASRNSRANRQLVTFFRLARAPASAYCASLDGLPSSSWCCPSRSPGGSCDQPSMSLLLRWFRRWTERRKQIDLISAQNFILIRFLDLLDPITDGGRRQRLSSQPVRWVTSFSYQFTGTKKFFLLEFLCTSTVDGDRECNDKQKHRTMSVGYFTVYRNVSAYGEHQRTFNGVGVWAIWNETSSLITKLIKRIIWKFRWLIKLS